MSVVKSLTEEETVEVEVLVSPEVCVRSKDVPQELFGLLDTMPSYTRPRATFSTRTAQLLRLAAALNEQGLVTNASKKARQWLVDQIRAEDQQLETEINAKVADDLDLIVDTTTVGMGDDITTDKTSAIANTIERDLDAYYARAQRLLPEASAAWYFTDLCDRDYDEVEAGVRVAALASLGFKAVIETHAASLIGTWRDAHQAAVAAKPRSVRELIEPLWYLGSSPMHPTTVGGTRHVSGVVGEGGEQQSHTDRDVSEAPVRHPGGPSARR